MDLFCLRLFKSFSGYGDGIIKVWPIRIRRGSNLGLAANSASTLTPYCRAIMVAVSPALTVCVRGLAAGVTVGRPAPADPAGTGWAGVED
jgi:hypothetical protein